MNYASCIYEVLSNLNWFLRILSYLAFPFLRIYFAINKEKLNEERETRLKEERLKSANQRVDEPSKNANTREVDETFVAREDGM